MLKGFSAKGQPRLGQLFDSSIEKLRLCDIGLNILDEMFAGKYHEKTHHINDTDQMLERANSLGLKSMICTSSNIAESNDLLSFCNSFPENSGLFCTIGIHPTRAAEMQSDPDETIRKLRLLIDQGIESGKVVALGECGLDYDRLHFSKKSEQIFCFQKQLDLAASYQLPLFLHNRNTAGDFLRMVTEHRNKLRGGGVVHSYTGSMEDMQALIDLDLYIGINGCSLKTEEGLANVAAIPDHLLLLETDAPWCGIKRTHAGFKYLTTEFPTTKKDKFEEGVMVKDRNEPCTMIQVLEIVAKVRQVDPIELAEQVYTNSEKLFPESYN